MTGCQTEDVIEEAEDIEMLFDDQEESDMEPDTIDEIEEEVKKALEQDEELPMEVDPISSTSNVEDDYVQHGDDNVNVREGNVNHR